ncbi:MAG: hypothetical protein UT43_C0004G0007 [Parcubacteria group bacterium GW2011_GWC1_39_29]|uniref:Uncharacterized protein n=1 Tax=Candidatus Yanofskybacteria bacterium GW2011_GWD1_39_16 TaxID=1619030 RepID=A0A837HUU7_9BACT|nr:MAG: hypothetical protein UT35_C0001G0007 [Candidatus Yanofskybacteria bacterium GW2011_GWD1_39_16]KKR15248.1 MAG: hypothetical protein UT43_C0004G0007 [Parcubacteria group bacterium GW2011_GWC1_39_29]
MGIQKKLKISSKKAQKDTSRSGLIKKGKFVIIRWLETDRVQTGFMIGISSKIIPLASRRNRLKRVIIELLNKTNSKIRSGTSMSVGLSKAGQDQEIIKDLSDILKNNFYV